MNSLEPTAVAPLPVAASAHSPFQRPAPAATARDPEGVRIHGPEERTSLARSLREVLERRDLLVQLAVRDVRIRYKQAVMGFAWAILMPLLIVGAGSLVRIAVVAMGGGQLDRSEIGSVVLKAFPWAFFAGALSFGVQSVTANITLVTKIYFPRAILPIAVVGAHLVDLAVGVAVLLVVLPFLGAQLTVALLWVPVLVALLLLLTAGLCTVLACANLFFRDVKYIVQVLITFGIFFTPVLFDNVAFGERGARLMMLNPLAPLFEGLRLAVFEGHNLLLPLSQTVRGVAVTAWEPWYLAYAVAWAAGSLAIGLVLFQRTQDLFAEFA